MKQTNARKVARLERLANEEGLTVSERYHRILEVWRVRGIEIPGYFEKGGWVY